MNCFANGEQFSECDMTVPIIIKAIKEYIYSGPSILRPPIQPERYRHKLKVVLKCRDIYIKNIKFVSLMVLKWREFLSELLMLYTVGCVKNTDHCMYNFAYTHVTVL